MLAFLKIISAVSASAQLVVATEDLGDAVEPVRELIAIGCGASVYKRTVSSGDSVTIDVEKRFHGEDCSKEDHTNAMDQMAGDLFMYDFFRAHVSHPHTNLVNIISPAFHSKARARWNERHGIVEKPFDRPPQMHTIMEFVDGGDLHAFVMPPKFPEVKVHPHFIEPKSYNANAPCRGILQIIKFIH